ncbi:MAG: HAMP domain-containing sensor histidine kinase [Myxococcota bacterium]|nr:HAMP domain-containing sensor histidine kinase [Myxococcota bacterium]
MGKRRSIGAPLAVGIVLMLLVLSLAVGWQLLVFSDIEPMSAGWPVLSWILVTLFFVLVLAGLVWLSVWLVAEVRLNQRQRAFLDAVTHEMKTPLASFRLGLDTLGRHQLEPAQQTEFVDRMQQDLDRLDHTVAQVLAAARSEERKQGVSRRGDNVALRPLLEECVVSLLERHGLEVSALSLEGGSDCQVQGDGAELSLVFGNLIENAIKYSDEPIRVHIRVRAAREGRVEVAISDQGIGIPPRELRRIFRRFYRVGRDVQRQVSGLGLGLFVVRSILKRQGGRVVAHSAGDGRGSRFVVTLRGAEARAPASSPDATRSEPENGELF